MSSSGGLPSTWLSCRLGDVVEYGAAERVEPSEIPEEAWVLELEDIEKGTSRLVHRRTCAERRPKSTKLRFHAGDVLYGKLRPYLNKVIRADQDGYCTTEIIPLAPSEAVDGAWLFYWLRHPSFVAYATASSHGLNMPRLGTEAAKRGPFILAPLQEQREIAQKIDSIVARIDFCRERLARVPSVLKAFRQAVIDSATSGQLTEAWRGPAPLSPEWQRVTIGGLLEHKPRNGYSPRGVEYETPVKSLTLAATTSGTFRSDHFKYIDEHIPESSHLWLQPGDILIQRANTIDYVGISAVYEGPPRVYIYPDLMMKCRANRSVLTKYLHLILLSTDVRRYFRAHATGTAGNMPKINQGTVMSAPAILPSLPEQHEIVRRVEALFLSADGWEKRYESALSQVGELVSSVIVKAFRGDLLPLQGNHEAASVVLSRYHAARNKNPKKTQPRRSKLVPAEERMHMNTLTHILEASTDWITAEEAFRRCGLATADTDRVEQLYLELRTLEREGLLETEVVADEDGRKLYDRIRLNPRRVHAPR